MYSKPNVTAVEVLPFFPDFVNWKHPCAQVIFDSDPAQAGKNVPAQIEEMSQAMIRYVTTTYDRNGVFLFTKFCHMFQWCDG